MRSPTLVERRRHNERVAESVLDILRASPVPVSTPDLKAAHADNDAQRVYTALTKAERELITIRVWRVGHGTFAMWWTAEQVMAQRNECGCPQEVKLTHDNYWNADLYVHTGRWFTPGWVRKTGLWLCTQHMNQLKDYV